MKIDNGTGGSRETSTGKPERVDERGRESINFFAELKRRHVDKVALVYAVVSWLLIAVALILLPIFEAPGWMMKAFVLLLALGFGFAVFVSWNFEMTPEGMKRTQDVSPGEVIPYWSRRKFATFIIGVAGAAFCLSAYHLLFPARVQNLSQSETVSISQSSPSGSPSEKPRGTQPV